MIYKDLRLIFRRISSILYRYHNNITIQVARKEKRRQYCDTLKRREIMKKFIPVAAILMATSMLTASPVLAATAPTSTVTVTIVDGKNTKDTADDSTQSISTKAPN